MGLLVVGVMIAWSPVRAFASKSSRPSLIASQRLFASSATSDSKQQPIPMTLLSGFLGSGKTTTLKHLLENTEGVKIGVIVNDVASVNIDAKLVSATNQGIVELQNGCACCSLADELLTSVQTLLQKKQGFDALVVELSGVADPVSVKSNWQTAKLQGHPVTYETDVTKVVTVVDACTFGTDYMTWDVAGERDGWTEEGDDCAGMRKVPELLAEQVEAADLLIINKIDLAGPEQVEIASSVARGLNAKADMQQVEFGRVSPTRILELPKQKETVDKGHSHGHDHDCTEPDCTDQSHSHSHDHSAVDCTDPGCTDESHSHSHEHASDCADPDCTDTSHSHSHSHNTSADKLGIVNFVYKAAKPFNSERLMALLNKWPVPIKDTLDIELLKDAQNDGYQINEELVSGKTSPFIGVLRSKGFCWFAPTKWTGSRNDVWRHDTAMYWSHAGRHFGITSAGKWWGTIPREQMARYFTDQDEYDRILTEDFVTEEFGDRRQELVFIGTNLDEDYITKALDECLCTDAEMNNYRQKLRNFMDTTFTAQASLFDMVGNDHIDEE
jgi:G3E family GTPase